MSITLSDGTTYQVWEDAQVTSYLTRNRVTYQDLLPGTRVLVWADDSGKVSRVLVFPYEYKGSISLDGYGRLYINGGTAVDPSSLRRPYKDERLYVPIRAVAEAAGYDVSWDKEFGVTVKDDSGIVFQIRPDTKAVHGSAVPKADGFHLSGPLPDRQRRHLSGSRRSGPPAGNVLRRLTSLFKNTCVQRTQVFFIRWVPYTAKNPAITEVMMPQTHSAIELIAPCSSPISIALLVPTAWLVAPMAMPSATGSVIWNSLAKTGARIAPSTPVIMTAAAVRPDKPPVPSAMLTAIAVVTLLGSREFSRTLSACSTWHKSRTHRMLARLPTRHPSTTGQKCCFRIARWR